MWSVSRVTSRCNDIIIDVHVHHMQSDNYRMHQGSPLAGPKNGLFVRTIAFDAIYINRNNSPNGDFFHITIDLGSNYAGKINACRYSPSCNQRQFECHN